MKKMFALLALCAMATSLMAVPFSDEAYKAGGLTLPVVYTGTLKITGWGDEGLCYNWQSTRNSYPLFLGLCQPCLDCVPCDIDMRHLESQYQFGNNKTEGAIKPKNAVPGLYAELNNTVDPTEAYFNRARLYLVNYVGTAKILDANGKEKTEKVATIKVIDLIDAYWGKAIGRAMFQFFNTVDSKSGTSTDASKGRIGAMYQFPIFSRDYVKDLADGRTYKKNDAYVANVVINQYNTDGKKYGHTTVANNNPVAGGNCVADRFEDGLGLAALIGTKDNKSFFKVDKKAYKIVSIKNLTGDLFAWQYNYTDNDEDFDGKRPQYVCRKGEEFVYYYQAQSVPATDQSNFDGRGTWYTTGSISLRRNDSVTKKLMDDLNKEVKSVNCIPCNTVEGEMTCRQYLDSGMVSYLIKRQFNGYKLTYLVDLDNDGVYGEAADCGGLDEKIVVEAKNVGSKDDDNYLASLVNVNDDTAATAANNYYNLPAESVDLTNAAAKSAGRLLETTAHPDTYHETKKSK